MSIWKSSCTAVSNGLRQTSKQTVRKTKTTQHLHQSVNNNHAQHTTATPLVVTTQTTTKIPTRGIQSSSLSLRGAGYLSDPGNTGTRSSGINFDQLGSWNNRLDLDVNMEHSIAAGSLIPRITPESCGTATVIGRRKQNEDRVLVSQISEDLLLTAIFDGHGGATAVDYMVKHIPDHVRYWVERGERDLGEVLKMTFRDVNETFMRLVSHHPEDTNGAKSGCTASVCLIHRGRSLVVGHVGDSQVILCRNGLQRTLTTPHKPEMAERDRIQAAGGWVTYDSLGNPRVNGRLEMSRSLGDADLKAYGVVADPEIQSVQLKHGKDAFIILTTDGVHFVLSPQEIVDIVCTCQEPHEAARFIADQALTYGSEDNCTSLIVPLGAWGKYALTKNMQFSFSRSYAGGRCD